MKHSPRTSARRRAVAVAAGFAALTAVGTAGVVLRAASADVPDAASAPATESPSTPSPDRDAGFQSAALRCSGPTCNPEQVEGRPPLRPTTTTTAARPPVAAIHWSLAPRAGGAQDSDDVNALAGYVNSPDQIRLNGCESTPGTSPIASYQWNFNGTAFTGCSPSVAVPGRSGSFNVSLTVTDSAGRSSSASTTGTWKDTFVVTLGDSIASGEGNPDVAQQYNGWFGAVSAGPQWPNKQCHRTPRAASQQAVSAFETSHPDQAVTYVNLACSGATILNVVQQQHGGQEYAGIEPQHAPNPPQLDVLKAIEGRTQRVPDAVILSAGANDFGFGPIANDCAHASHEGSTDCAQLDGRVADGRHALEVNYPKLKMSLEDAQVPASKVLISQYPNPTRNDDAQLCNKILDDTPFGLGTIHKEDIRWADDVVQKLNTDVGNAAAANGWNVVPGIASGFGTHGYCASDHWITRYSESDHNQGNIDGSLHPNAAGTTHYRNMITQGLTQTHLLQ